MGGRGMSIAGSAGVDMQTLTGKIQSYVDSGSADIESMLSSAEIKYLYGQMKTLTNDLTRVEESTWTADRLKEGSSFSFVKPLKSFSRNPEYPDRVINERHAYRDPVVFETVGKVKQLNLNLYANSTPEYMAESLAGGKFKVKSIGTKRVGNKRVKVIKIEQISSK